MEDRDIKSTAEQAPEDATIKGAIPVKFNKKILYLSNEEAATLAQKGMKYDSISDEISRISALARKKGVQLAAFIGELERDYEQTHSAQTLERCGGDKDLAEYVLKLEGTASHNSGFEELKRLFPEFESEEQLPESVRNAALLRGSQLLDEYLRYRLAGERAAKQQRDIIKSRNTAGIGSLAFSGTNINSAPASFLQGLWRK